LPAAAFAALLAVCSAVAARRGWPLSFRRALFFFLLLSLLGFGTALLPPGVRDSWGPGLLAAAQVLAWVGVIECCQGTLFDLVLAGWLGRPPAPRILRDFLTLALALGVLLLALRGALGVNLASLLATSAMITVVLGLALQDTLGSFFAGLALQMEAPLAIGDWVQIGDSQGRVSQVSWRSVRIVNLESDEVTLPNSLVTRSTLVNFSRPDTAHQSFVAVRVHYRHPPNQVIAALVDAVRGTPGVLDDPPAHALLWEFSDSEIVYRARYWIGDYRRVNAIRSDVGARLWYGLRRAGIENAYPVRVHRRDTPAGGAGDPVAGALLRVEIFSPLSGEEIRSLASRVRVQAYGRGETVIRQGDGGDSLFVILRGRVEVLVASRGQEEVVDTLGPGSCFGEMSLLTGAPRSATVRALEDVELAPVAAEAFRRIVAENQAVLEAVAGIVGRRRSRLDAAIREAESEAAARSEEHRALLERIRAFFGV
jgi:small-conductance mechanosensitive channel/CRP-like cAMP-binding protein